MPDGTKLAEFVAWCHKNINGDEKGQAQIFLDRLFQAFGQPGCLDVGGSTEFRVLKADDDGGGTAFADYVWKPVVLVEMKKRGTDLQKHYRQAFDYWTRLVPNRPRYVVLCNFDEFRIYDFDSDLDTPKDTLALKDLPQRWGPLAFLAPGSPAPRFDNDRETVTRDAADRLAECFKLLLKRGEPRELAQRFVLQMLVALFAEDIDLLPKYFVADILKECESPADGYDLIGGLFEAMNTNPPKSGGRYKGVSYFNGGLFREPARVEINELELNLLRKAASYDWSKVQPEVFGTLFQHSMDAEERHAYGAHYTSPSDIMKIVGPTIVEPWREQIEGAKTLKRLVELRDRLNQFRVLDPACGSGNFLYIAYRELKRLEARLIQRMQEFPSRAEPGQRMLSFLSVQNFYGLDILPFAVEIAKVTMMIGRKLAIDELHITEPALPLDNLDKHFLAADALLTPGGLPAQWPKADVIIGNPPFLGVKKLKPERGADYVNKLRKAYAEVPGMADYCVYWIRKAADHLPACTAADPVAGRAGLVGTQNIRNNQSRVGGLEHVVKTGTIVEAVESQPWSGEAAVHVSIANWAKTQDAALLSKTRKLWFKVEPSAAGKKKIRKRGSGPATKDYELNVRDCDEINSTLSDQSDVSGAAPLRCNTDPQQVFNGQFPRHQGFVIEPDEARELLAADPRNREVVHAFLIGQELVTSGKPERWVIDFQKMDILQAQTYAAPFAKIRETVLPHIEEYARKEREKTGLETGQDQTWLKLWWQHFRCRKELVDRVSKFGRYIVCSGVTKCPIFNFASSDIRPDHALFAFAFEDDYSFGILQSSAHWLWFITKCSKLGEQFRYTPESVFDTFPWPQFAMGSATVPVAESGVAPDSRPTKISAAPNLDERGFRRDAENRRRDARAPQIEIAKIDAVAAAARELRAVRAEALPKIKGGLRALYRTLELPGANPLKDAHAALDAAVLAAYAFNAKKDLLAQLLALNQEVAAKIEKGEPVTPPGMPANYPDAKKLLTEDCIRPSMA